MRDHLIQQMKEVLQQYKSIKLEDREEDFVLFAGQESDSQQPVSIKFLPRLLGQDPKIAARFSGLARTIRQLNHPNIASVRTVGEEEGLPYIVTRAIEKGHSLAARLDQPWAVDRAADAISQIGQALEHAYKKGVVHGDLTPDSVAVEDDGRVLVTDFGLSEMKELVGGPAKQAASPYLAPERMAGQAADARADVYSMGALLYSMLTKKIPEGAIVPPSHVNPDVPQAMDKVVAKALALDPADRYPDARAFLSALAATTLVPAKTKALPATSPNQCPNCGAGGQTGRFCRKCGQRLEQPVSATPPQLRVEDAVLDEPIQVTKVEVGRVETGQGIELTRTDISQPMPVVSGKLDVEFPEPLEVPQLDMESLWPTLGDQPLITMPEPPDMPVIDWAELAPPMPEVPIIEDTAFSEESD